MSGPSLPAARARCDLAHFLDWAKSDIDERFGKGFAAKNPQAIGDYLIAAALMINADKLDDLVREVRAIAEKGLMVIDHGQ